MKDINCILCQPKQRVLIELVKADIIYDIRNEAYIYARSLRGDKIDNEYRTNITDIGEEGNIDRTARLMDEAVADVNEMLYAYTKVASGGGSMYATDEWEEATGNPANDDECYYLAMQVSPTFAVNSVHNLATYLHVLIVDKVLQKYMITVFPEGAETYSALVADLEAKVRRCVAKTFRPVRRRMHPF